MPGTRESAYFVGVNRNKRSVTLDIAQARGPGDRAAADRAVRHPGRELQGRRAGEIRSRLRAAAPEISAADLLLDHRLRPDRAVRAAAWLRQPDPGDGRRDEPDRRAGRAAAEGRRAGRRSVRRASMAASASSPRCATASDRAGAADRHRHARHARRVAGQPGDELPGDRREPAHGSATSIRTSCRIRCSRPPTATSCCRSATTRRSSGSATRSALTHLLEDERFATNAARVREPATGHRHTDAGDAGADRPAGGSSGWRR